MLQKTKTVKLMDFQSIFSTLALLFILFPLQAYLFFFLHSNSFSDIFLSPCKPGVLFLEKTSLCPALLFAYSTSDTEGEAPVIIGG